jgi:2-dehydropantoate 2-reductase
MKVGLIGPGAVGCVVAAALVDEHELELGARTPFERLVVTGVPTPIDRAARVFTEPTSKDAKEVVLVATKAHQTRDARAWFDTWCAPATIVVVMQNGIEQTELGRELAPDSQIVPAVVSCPARRSAPGVARLVGRAELVVPDDAAGRAIHAMFRGTHVEVVVTDAWLTEAWSKLLFIAAAGAITTLVRAPNTVLRDPGARSLALALMQEVASVARREGANLPPHAVEAVLDRYLERAGQHVASITADRLAGIASEWKARNAVVVSKAAEHGIAVPLNAALTTLVRLSEP